MSREKLVFGSDEATFYDRRTLLRRFVDHGALTPDTARSCVGIGRDLSDRTAGVLKAHGLLSKVGGTDRFWVSVAGLDALRRWEGGDYRGFVRFNAVHAGRKPRHLKGATA